MRVSLVWVKFYLMHISQNKLFFLLIDVSFDAESKSEIRIFQTGLVFELQEENERKNRHNKTQVSKYFLMPTYEISFLYRYYIIFRC